MTVRIERTLVDTFPVEYEPRAGARIGVVPRGGAAAGRVRGKADDVVWCAVEPCVVLHTANAHETEVGGRTQVVLTALRSLPKSPQSYICSYTPAFLYRWTISIDQQQGKATCVDEQYLSTVPVEFPMVNPLYCGDPESSFVWCISPASAGGPLTGYATPESGILIDGLVMLDMRTGATGEEHGYGSWQVVFGWALSALDTTSTTHFQNNGGYGVLATVPKAKRCPDKTYN